MSAAEAVENTRKSGASTHAGVTKTGRTPGMIENFKHLMTPEGRRLFNLSLGLAIVVGVIQGAALLALLPASTALASGEPSWGLGIGGWLIVLAVLAVVNFIISYFQVVKNFDAAMDMITRLHQVIGDHVARLPLGWFKQGFAATSSRLVSDGILGLAGAVAHMIYPIYVGTASGLVLLAGTWIWKPKLGLALTIAVPVFALIMWASAKVAGVGMAQVEPSRKELSMRIVEFASNQPALRSAGRADDDLPLEEALAEESRASRRDLWYSLLGNLLNGVVTQIVVIGLIMLAAGFAISGELAPLEAFAFIGIALRANQILAEIGEQRLGIEAQRPNVATADRLLGAPVLSGAADPVTLSEPGQIELDHVSFGYLPEVRVLDDVSLEVPARTMTALVGPSGSGKTTIARLVARFYDIDSGTVRVGGVDVRDQPVEQLMGQLSMVFQDVYLFDDTLRANVLVGNPSAPDEQVQRAADLAGVSEIVDRLPDGWNSLVGEGGRALSGGERQRVSVARALLKGSEIVLLDEATSALDPENEANVVAAVEALRRRSTVLVIAHKLDTIRSADAIVVFDDDGTVVQAGTHEELIAVDGRYRDFWHSREQAAGWRLTAERDARAGSVHIGQRGGHDR